MAGCANPTYLPASFKGAPFQIESSNDEVGRRGDEYEYPLAEHTSYKDLGRKIRTYKLSGYIIGDAHVALSLALRTACESPEPGILLHPAWGPVRVACKSSTASIEYRENKRRTKFELEFVEANDSLAPFAAGAALSALFAVASLAIAASVKSARWLNTAPVSGVTLRVSQSLARAINPAVDEQSWDAVSVLERGADSPAAYLHFPDAVEPIIDGSAKVRRLHNDAQARLRAVRSVALSEVERAKRQPAASQATGLARDDSLDSLLVTTRLAVARDFALVTAQRAYATVRDALRDLDFVMAVYDDEEAVATQRCADQLVSAIRDARAMAASSILARNVRLPGVSDFALGAVLPSLVAAQQVHGDASRYAEIEAYNPIQPPFFMGRTVTALSA